MKSIEQMREELAVQILEIALKDDNPQFKLDAYKAVNVKVNKVEQSNPPPEGMAIFQARVRKAQAVGANGGDDDE